MRASNSEGLGPWSAPSTPVRTLTTNPGPPPAPRLASSRPPPGPLSLWLSIFLPNDDGGDPISAVLLETREHSGARAPEWSRCERHSVPLQPGNQQHFIAASGEFEGAIGVGSSTISSMGSGATGGSSSVSVGGNTTLGGESGCSTARTDPGAPMRELIVHVDGLKPRTHYSFRASAVNGKGSGDPGPPCRRVRTSLPRPPTWSPIDMKALASANTPKILANIEAKNVSGARNGSKSEDDDYGLGPAPPRAILSGHGACSVAWEEPHDNGAPIESYQVECTRLGAVVDVENLVDIALVVPPVLAAAGDQRIVGEKLSTGFEWPEGATGESSPQPTVSPPSRTTIIAPSGHDGQRREEIETVVRTIGATMRVMAIEDLAVHGEYVFRVAGVNAAGRGDLGPWSAIVKIPDPHD